MEYMEVKEWLDRLIAVNKEIKSLEWYSNDIRVLMHEPIIQFYSGIEIVADVMGLELKRELRAEAVRLSFKYSGTEFCQVSVLEDNENEVQGNK